MAKTPESPLFAQELETFEARREELLGEFPFQKGRHVVIKGEKILGTSSSFKDALHEGWMQLGIHTPFLVKEIKLVEK